MRADQLRKNMTNTHRDDFDAEVLFGALSDSRRRFVLSCLREYATPMALGDIADELAVREQEVPITAISAEEVTSIYISLYHCHIPKMADVGIVEYSQDRDAVTLTEKGGELISMVSLPTPGDR